MQTSSLRARSARHILLAPIVLLSLVSLTACNRQGSTDPVGGEGAAGGLATLTAVAAGADSLPTPAATADSSADQGAAAGGTPSDAANPAGTAVNPSAAAGGPDNQAKASGTQVPTSPVKPNDAASGDSILSQSAAYKGTQAAANATAGIADVSALIAKMPALATFTPAPAVPAISGRILYLRNGKFYTVSAAGGDSKPAALADAAMPPVWAPPEDPGRAWPAPDRSKVAFFTGSDASMWIMNADGSANHAVSADNLPTDQYSLSAGTGAPQSVRLRPGKDYTLIYMPDEPVPFGILVDNNDRHIKGEGRVRVVHAAAGARARDLVPFLNGTQSQATMGYGRSVPEERVQMGNMRVEVKDTAGQPVMTPKSFMVAERELKTIFIYGDKEITAVGATYEPGSPPAGSARVRIFNASSKPLNVKLDGKLNIAGALAPGTLSLYVPVRSVLSDSQRKDAQMSIYGLRADEEPVAWSPDSQHVAYIGVVDGALELFRSTVAGPATRITHDARAELNPTWSPDGKNLAWAWADEATGEQGLSYLLEGQSKGTDVDFKPLRAQMKWPDKISIHFVAGVHWADNDRLYLFPAAEQMTAGIWVFNTRNGQFNHLYPTEVSDPDYNPVVKAWVFEDHTVRGKLYLQPLDGEKRELVKADGHAPQWSPDGKLISWTEGDPASPDGWRIHAMRADGTGDKALTDRLPIMQEEPPVPGPNAKRVWVNGGKSLMFMIVGHDYGASEKAGLFGQEEAGADIENFWITPTDGSQKPHRASDLTKVFYLRTAAESPQSGALAFVGFSYLDRAQQLWTMSSQGGKPVHLDAGVRWFMWQAP